jgi:hypothetical protein
MEEETLFLTRATGFLFLNGGKKKADHFFSVGSVLVTQLGQEEGLLDNFINQPVFIGDPSGQITGEGMLERFGITYTLEGIGYGFFDEGIDALKDFPVPVLPGEIVFPVLL